MNALSRHCVDRPLKTCALSCSGTASWRLHEPEALARKQPNHVPSRSARKASARFRQRASRAEGSAPLPLLRPQAERQSRCLLPSNSSRVSASLIQYVHEETKTESIATP